MLLVDLGGEGGGALDVRIGRFEPEEVRVRCESNAAFCCCRNAGAEVVETFAGARDVPGEGDGGGGVF